MKQQVTVSGVLLNIVVSSRARRTQIRIDGRTGIAKLIVPRGQSHLKAVEFARSKAKWLQERRDALPEAVPFTDGMILPFRGQEHRVIHVPGLLSEKGHLSEKGDVRLVPRGEAMPFGSCRQQRPEIWVADMRENLPTVLVAWLKRQAYEDLLQRSHMKAKLVGRKIHRIQVRDTVSRWGSCSSKGNLSYSWRLILAPDHVRDYMSAHEVAHLKYMNHGSGFWALCDQLCALAPRSESEAYLRMHGHDLFAYGRS